MQCRPASPRHSFRAPPCPPLIMQMSKRSETHFLETKVLPRISGQPSKVLPSLANCKENFNYSFEVSPVSQVTWCTRSASHTCSTERVYFIRMVQVWRCSLYACTAKKAKNIFQSKVLNLIEACNSSQRNVSRFMCTCCSCYMIFKALLSRNARAPSFGHVVRHIPVTGVYCHARFSASLMRRSCHLRRGIWKRHFCRRAIPRNGRTRFLAEKSLYQMTPCRVPRAL